MLLNIVQQVIKEMVKLKVIHPRRVVVSYERMYVHKVLDNRLFKLAQGKAWLGQSRNHLICLLGRKARKQKKDIQRDFYFFAPVYILFNKVKPLVQFTLWD